MARTESFSAAKSKTAHPKVSHTGADPKLGLLRVVALVSTVVLLNWVALHLLAITLSLSLSLALVFAFVLSLCSDFLTALLLVWFELSVLLPQLVCSLRSLPISSSRAQLIIHFELAQMGLQG